MFWYVPVAATYTVVLQLLCELFIIPTETFAFKSVNMCSSVVIYNYQGKKLHNFSIGLL